MVLETEVGFLGALRSLILLSSLSVSAELGILETEVGFLGALRSLVLLSSLSVSAELGILEETVVPCSKMRS
jgi:hypothetical protein